jgi:hypothetical protein
MLRKTSIALLPRFRYSPAPPRAESIPQTSLNSQYGEQSTMRLHTTLRRTFIIVALVVAFTNVTAAGTIGYLNSGRQLTLRQQLTYGLRVATKQDQAFVDKVVAFVHAGILPRNLVDSTFLWARQQAFQRGGTAAVRPMIYFRPALEMRAKRLRVLF